MPNIIKPKRSNSAGVVPTTGNLVSGELGVNMADKKVYINNGTAVVQVGAGNLTGLADTNITTPANGQALTYDSASGKWINSSAGAGDVIGAASSTDNAIVRFDGTTGKIIQNSTVTLDDNGNFVNANSIGLDTTPATVPTTVGTISWDDGEGVPTVILKGGNTTLEVGTQEYARVYNDSGATLTIGQVVYISGAQGNRVAVKLARADVEATSFGTIGIVAESIANGAEGFIIVSGALGKLNTTGLTAGATVYLSPTTAGAYTTTKPQAPNQLVVIGWVERVDNIVGSIYVKIDNGYELDELHDVQITSPQSGNLLIYDASTSPIGVWKNANLTDGTGITITEGAGSITIANSGVTSLTGTANEVEVSASTGAITISLPATINANTTGNAANVTGTVAIANGGTGATDAATARSNLGLAIGTNVQAYDADLAAIAALTPTADNFIVGNGTTWILETPAQARTSLGATTLGSNLITITNPSAVTFPRFNADNTVSALDAATFRTAIGAGTGNGTVTSVTGTSPVASSGGATPAISLASGYGDTQNPYASKTANFFLAAPNGTAGVPTFRAIVAADIPTLNQNTTGTSAGVVRTVTGTNSAELVRGNMADNDQFRILVGGTATNAGYVEIATADDGTEPIYVRQYTGTFTSLTRTATLLDGSGNTIFPGSVTANGVVLTGNTGTVTSVALSGGTTGLTVSGSPITTSGTITLAGTLAIANGGTGTTTAAGARTNLGATTLGANLFTITNPSAITFPRFNADNTVSALDAATFRTAIGAGTGNGSVTGVTATSPVASSGGTAPVISLNSAYGDTLNPYGSKTANFVLAAPNGTAGAPTFRALVAADIPTLNQNTTGTASNVTGVVAIANGGTGQTTQQAALNAIAGAVTSGSYLRGNGTNVVMSAIQASDVPTLNQNTTGSAATLTTGRTIGMTGDVNWTSASFNGSANVTGTSTLATVNSNVGTFGSASSIPVVTVNAKGLVTAVSTATVAGGQYFGTAAVKAIAYNANTIAENVTVTSGNNGLSAGPITINTGFTVTVQTGAVWVIV